MRRFTVLFISVLFIAGCASGPATQSGFLTDYSELKPEEGKDSILTQRPPPSFRPGDYSSVFIEKPSVQVPDITATEADQLQLVFATALAERFAVGRKIVEQPGDGVLHVRSAITEARKANVALNIATSLLGAPISAGSVSGEAEILDGRTGKRVAALSWTRRGQALTDLPASYASLGQVRSGLRAFAKRLALLVG
ncbi:DUF3313 domain-containing protein [Nostoc sp. CHAB 5824]|nr:DUF3313 domain-containing protein [Nostoc sp. CHAB 5824]